MSDINLLNQVVIHKSSSIGRGVVIEQDGHHFIVDFSGKRMKFAIKTAFKGFLTMEDVTLMDEVNTYIANLEAEERAAIEKKKEDQRIKEAAKPLLKTKTTRKNSVAEMNYAFKCNFCDGGKDQHKIGFSGACSDSVINNNINVEHRDWCGQTECWCKQYYLGNITRAELDEKASDDFICYEAEMLTKWIVKAGTNTADGARKGTARTIPNLAPGKLCILTTRDPKSDSEDDRYIFAAFIIGSCDEGDIRQAGYITAMPGYTITFSDAESHKLKFWDYHQNSKNPEIHVWNSGLYRKFGDDEAKLFLDAMVDVKKNAEGKVSANKIRDYYLNRNAN